MGEVGVGSLEPVASRLISPLQWLAIGAIAGGISISAGPFSTAYLSGLIWAYAAHRGRLASDDPNVRTWWASAAVLSLLSAVCSFAGWFADAVGIAGQCLGIAVIVVLNWTLHDATRERDMTVSTSWRRVAVTSVPAGALAMATMVVALVSGEPYDPEAGGSYVRIGSAQLTVPDTVQRLVLGMLVPLLVTVVWSVVLFVRTYRTVNAATRNWERLQRDERLDGIV